MLPRHQHCPNREEHQIGALAWPVASAITSRRSFMASGHYRSDWRKRSLWRLGAPWELIKEFEVSAEHIAAKAVELIGVKKSRSGEPVAEVHLVGQSKALAGISDLGLLAGYLDGKTLPRPPHVKKITAVSSALFRCC